MNQLVDTRPELSGTVSNLEFSLRYQKRTYELLLNQKDRASDVFNSIMSEGFREMNQALAEFRNGIDQITEAVREISRATEDITGSIQEQRDTAATMSRSISDVSSSTKESHSRLETLDEGIEDLQKNSTTIGTLIHNIEDIAETLNVLSINGAIQAARSGDIGQGFAVVTGEMRKLALSVKDSASHQMGVIQTVLRLIDEAAGMSRDVRSGMETNKTAMEKADAGINDLSRYLDLVASNTTQLAASVHEFSATIEQISRSISSIEDMMARIAGNFDQSITFNRKVSEATRKIQHFAETSRSLAEAAHRQVAYLRNEDMDENGQKNLVLARIFLSLPYTELPPEYQREIESGGSLPDPEDRFLCLMGTAGDEPDWNDPLRSRGHKYMKLPDREEDLVQMPMIQKVFAEFGVPYSAILRPDSSREHSVEGYFLADDPAASPYIPDKGFVSDYGIRSQVSIGGVLPSGSIFTMFLFSRQKLTHDMAEAISVYGPVLQMTFKEFDDEGNYW